MTRSLSETSFCKTIKNFKDAAEATDHTPRRLRHALTRASCSLYSVGVNSGLIQELLLQEQGWYFQSTHIRKQLWQRLRNRAKGHPELTAHAQDPVDAHTELRAGLAVAMAGPH